MKCLSSMLVPLAVVAGGWGCSGRNGCTDIGCLDGATIVVRSEDNTWAGGEYEVTLTLDGSSVRCAINLPEELTRAYDLGGNSVLRLKCEGGSGDTSVYFRAETVCATTSDGTSCDDVPGEYFIQVNLLGTPADASISIERDGEELMSKTIELPYERSRPNGPGCTPVCRYATADVKLD